MKLTAKGYVHRAGLRCRKGDRSGALADLDRAIDLDPSMATGYFARGDLKRVGGDPDGAIADLTIAIQLNPNFPRAYVSRGNAHRNKGEANAAVADFNKAIRLDAKSALAYIGRGMARLPAGTAIRDFNRAIRLDPKSPEAFFGRGWAHFSRGDAAGAISDLTRAIDLNPQHSVAFMFRGEAYRDKGETDRAIADLTEAIRLGVPDWGYAYGQRGVERLRKGDFKGALVDLTKSIESHSKQPSRSGATDAKLAALYLSRGTALLGSGDARSSISDLNFAVRMDPSLKRLARPLLNSAQQQSSKPRKPRKELSSGSQSRRLCLFPPLVRATQTGDIHPKTGFGRHDRACAVVVGLQQRSGRTSIPALFTTSTLQPIPKPPGLLHVYFRYPYAGHRTVARH